MEMVNIAGFKHSWVLFVNIGLRYFRKKRKIGDGPPYDGGFRVMARLREDRCDRG